ncbi:cutinase-domain-containing protein [Stachybotrys elegans]|uniref:Cutinase-domain-containing protein n=1 Tax=Stachybotrys elegans TaxID=80388 RepID=A0A8K0SLU2_9HYPO|nr:cutinase-domain-containing protein [Stachybotrys elegans]
MVRLDFASILFLAAVAVGQRCPANPGRDPSEPPFGQPVTPRPGDVPSGCSPFEILSARGTSESGKFGYRVGDPVIGNVTAVLNGARGYPVQYPASIDFDSGIPIGARDVANRLASQSRLCPDQTFSLIGYSQGAMVIRAALDLIPASLFPKIKSLVFFGDPYYQDPIPGALTAKLLENCATGDNICNSSGTYCPYGHVSYTFPQWVELSEAFIVEGFAA